MKCILILTLCCLALPACVRNREPDPEPVPASRPDAPVEPVKSVESGTRPPGVTPYVKPGLPAGFSRKGMAREVASWLGPAAQWRDLVSRLSQLRADARAAGEDVLLTFERDAVLKTARDGSWERWRLPPGLRLEGVPAHLLLGSDLSSTVFDARGTELQPDQEVTVVTARYRDADGSNREIRLVVKAGRVFRSISNAG